MASQIVTQLKEVPVTMSRPAPTEDLQKAIPNPGAPRANVAISREKPEGSEDTYQKWGEKDKKTVLQQHVDLWTDENGCVRACVDLFERGRCYAAHSH